MKQGLVKFFQKLLVYFWCQKHEHVSPHFYTTLTRVLHDPMFIGNIVLSKKKVSNKLLTEVESSQAIF